MELIIDGKERIDVARLHTLTAFSKKNKMSTSKVQYWMLTGKLMVIEIGGVKFIVD